ncbi:prepilin-type N-terminal cleavage/methylation domain-containing protein [Bradyrhizobium sp. AUGA SZCCT0051]|uniref:type IV pilus modification PilV family protein n=2 Tax=Bradyrhizobium TaxID=374 RepID=UPI0039089022
MRGRLASQGRAHPGAATVSSRWAAEAWLRSMRSRAARRGRRSGSVESEAGFTLVEIIVALAILSAGLSLVLGMISSALQRTASAEKMATAGSIAQSLMAKVGTEVPVGREEREGKYPDGYRWRVRMQPLAEANQGEGRLGLYALSTEVEWGEGADARSFALTTLRLGPRVTRR